jgi:hypothetical protein
MTDFRAMQQLAIESFFKPCPGQKPRSSENWPQLDALMMDSEQFRELLDQPR